ncbi:MAG: VanW family protein [Oscillospiraceae bacterium]|nr:VanW family protein [Oscillospiraceae bacterium]
MLITAIVIIGALAAAGFYVNGLDTVFPNVSMGGVKLAGMTLAEAEQALIDAGYEENAANIAVTVNFPDGEGFSIAGEEVGMKLRASDAAQLALEFGRDGSFFGNIANYVKYTLSPTELSSPDSLSIDSAYVRSVTDKRTDEFNSGLLRGGYTISDSEIVIVKGAGSALADSEAVFEATFDALYESARTNSPVEVEYDVPSNSGGNIDIGALQREVSREPVSAVYDPDTLNISESSAGVSFDADAARAMLDSAATGERIVIPLVFTQPEVTKEQLEGLLFRDILAERTTNVAGTSNRVKNISLASEAIDGLILNPGDEFSFNGVVGQRTAEKGYMSAGAYAGGKTIQEIGGGICQVSSTIYDCVLHADLEVSSRSNHMFVVTYLPYGNDATVNWGTIDFKFKNSTDYPIKIESVLLDRKLTVKLHGTKIDAGYVKTDYVTISTTGFDTVEMEDESIEPGTSKVDTSGHGGLVVETYKYYYDADGNLLNKTFVSRSTYRAQNKIVLVPPGTLEPDPTESPDESDGSPSDGDPTGASPSDASASGEETAPPTDSPAPPTDDTPSGPSDSPIGETPTDTPATDDPLPEAPPDRQPEDDQPADI